MIYLGAMEVSGKMTIIDTVILAALFFTALFFCADAEVWQQLVAASLVSLVLLEWLKIEDVA